MSVFYPSQFKPAWWLRNNHCQTILAKYLRHSLTIETQDERFSCPDGDFIELAWTEKPSATSTKPLMVILHGLAGSKQSHYAKGLLQAAKDSGWIGVLMHFRGCGEHDNLKAQSYHSGDTRDISAFSQYLTKTFPLCPKVIVGFSLGGNVLANFLAENNHPYQASVIVNAPLHLSSCSKKIGKGFSKIYQTYLVNMLKEMTQRKIDQQLISFINTPQLEKIKSMWQFDQQVTAPLNGFNGAEHYYQQVSGRDLLAKIRIPTLIIHASDDPFLDNNEITRISKLPNNIRFEVSDHGGHVGFVSGNNPFKPQFWLEQRIPNFLRQHL